MQYLKIKKISERYNISRITVMRMIDELEETRRYPDGSIIRMPGAVLVSDAAIHDFITHRADLKSGLNVSVFDTVKTEAEMRRLNIR